ncbi:MAG: 2-C-methyl-D-erythritol 2,4-cyclodiphosphate synthase [Candidatus Margulisiibacteriota bacterium]|nr:MAG: 2-C-methyl-D-erythritol 2,4-cyclodiphosphate synthase [Candidatus Margulisiibacteriota bacterium]HCY37622.1 2-C-methyl-D-erythritol 2,4-cyclodiphosphate synthase [Candidatus Margulisiibacteriota bacterium]
MRVGIGYDVHQLVENRKLILGGVDVPYEKGLLGHSDADVLVHAIIDALLGGAGLGVIGQHFPDTDNQYKNIDSMVLLRRTNELLAEKGFEINNIDATIIAQKPKLLPYFDAMTDNLADVLKIDRKLINIKATTTEYLGFEGRGEGIKAVAVCTVL